MVGSARDVVGDDGIHRPTELVCRSRGVKYEPIAVNQKTKLVGPWVFGTVEPNVEIASYVDRLMVRGDSVEDRGQFVKKLLLHSDRARVVYIVRQRLQRTARR